MFSAGPDLSEAILSWGRDRVADKDLADDGRELDPHVTIKWGFKSDRSLPIIRKIFSETAPFEITVGPCGIFPGKEYDVIKFGVRAATLNALHAQLSKLPNDETPRAYQPHLTVAYVKPGRGQKFIGKSLFSVFPDLDQTFKPTFGIYKGPGDDRDKDRVVELLPMRVKPTAKDFVRDSIAESTYSSLMLLAAAGKAVAAIKIGDMVYPGLNHAMAYATAADMGAFQPIYPSSDEMMADEAREQHLRIFKITHGFIRGKDFYPE